MMASFKKKRKPKMKFIQFPAPITINKTLIGQPIEATVFDGKKIVRERCTASNFGKSLDALVAQHKILSAVDKMGEDNVLTLEDADYKYLLEATDSPEGGYNPLVAFAIIDFLLAIRNAKNDRS